MLYRITLILITLSSLFLFSCGDAPSSQQVENTEDTMPEAEQSTQRNPVFATEAAQQILSKSFIQMIGNNLIESIRMENGTVVIQYYADHAAYLKNNSNNPLSKEKFDRYWDETSKIEKAFASMPASLMRKNRNIQAVTVKIPSNGKVYEGTISQKDIETLAEMDFSEIGKNWYTNYQGKFVTDPEGRKKLFDQFVTIK